MTDYLEEQEMEVEALQAILMEDMVVVHGSEGVDLGGVALHAPCYQIAVSALGDGEEEDEADESQTARLGLVFSHTPAYPDEPPLIKCRSIKGLFDRELQQIQARMVKQAAGAVGMSMVFDLVGEAKEWMRDRAGVVDELEETPEAIASRLEEEAEARLRAMRATGTAESFTAWTQRLEAEEALRRIKESGAAGAGTGAATAEDDARKMTGRQYFEERTAGEEEEDGAGVAGGGDEDCDFEDDDFDDEFDEDDDDLLEFIAGGGGAGSRSGLPLVGNRQLSASQPIGGSGDGSGSEDSDAEEE
eukprot:CAMPEP_0181371844 /NCGR_PEP_ID=MMETSP1106-20121128/14352_1 /TAXON_ID=81844 /ORGANISM="Mantoniella antarctica, Strain SL-175" /LENGTH=302 /DNA_ID=CAMNT_0023489083 /DNA_START=46 /DNA_END=954 /DNA_ORIENTATION=-